MANERGPYPAEREFERWHDDSGIYQRRITGTTTITVNYLPNIGWGYVIVVADVVVSGRYDMDWTTDDAMEAALEVLPESSW